MKLWGKPCVCMYIDITHTCACTRSYRYPVNLWSTAAGSTSDWKHLCIKLNVNSKNLFNTNENERLIAIIQQHQQQTDGPDMTVKTLYKALKSIEARRAASFLLSKALDVCELSKRSASESRMQPSTYGLANTKSRSSFSYDNRQKVIYTDSLSESESETDP